MNNIEQQTMLQLLNSFDGLRERFCDKLAKDTSNFPAPQDGCRCRACCHAIVSKEAAEVLSGSHG